MAPTLYGSVTRSGRGFAVYFPQENARKPYAGAAKRGNSGRFVRFRAIICPIGKKIEKKGLTGAKKRSIMNK